MSKIPWTIKHCTLESVVILGVMFIAVLVCMSNSTHKQVVFNLFKTCHHDGIVDVAATTSI